MVNAGKLIIIVLSMLFVFAVAANAQPVYFADANLKARVEAALGISDPTPTDMLALTTLSAGGRGITDLTGLEYATNLTTLYLQSNQISNISALAGLTNLTYLRLNDNQILNISPLASLTNLTKLYLRGNQISDISAVAGLTYLTTLYLNYNQISDISALSAHTNLELVYLTGNLLNPDAYNIYIPQILTNNPGIELYYDPYVEEPVYFADANLKARVEAALGISDPTPNDMLALTTLYAGTQMITDITGLEYATNLTQLYLQSNHINDISALAGLTNLTELVLNNNEISDISALAGLVNLTELDLFANQIGDISTLAGLTNLTNIQLGGNQISDISALAGLTNLTELYLGGNQISDISALAGLTNLEYLDLLSNQISDISSLNSLTNLEYLALASNQISDISALAGLMNLEGLRLRSNQISDISALAGLTNLWGLDLNSNQISDISALAGLTNLEWLDLEDNQISDISSLTGLTNLEELDLRGNPLNLDAYNIYIPQIYANNPGIELYYDPYVEEPVYFPDENLKARVEAVLGISDPTPTDMLALTSLSASSRGITDITGLEYANNLTLLSLGFNEISDISAVAGLTDLTTLLLNSNQISDISAVTGLTNLTELNLNSNQISDISAVAGLTNLTVLGLGSNQISDISALTGLTNLTSLTLGSNQISDISALAGLTNLEELDLRGNPLNLDAYNIYIPQILTNNPGIELYYDPYVEEPVYFADENLKARVEAVLGVSDPTPTDMLALTTLIASSRGITDITGIEYATNLTELALQSNQISDISALAGLTNLDELDLRGNPLNKDAFDIYIPQILNHNPGISIFYDPYVEPPPTVTVPTVTTQSAMSVGRNSATLCGFLDDDGGEICEYRFCYYRQGESEQYTLWEGSLTSGDFFSVPVTNLEPDSLYYFVVYARNSADTASGDQLSFHTLYDEVSEVYLYVDDDAVGDPGPNDPTISNPNENGSLEQPFDMIQEGIDMAQDGYTLIVLPGTYLENINFRGKHITITSKGPDDPNDPNQLGNIAATVIDGSDNGTAVTFESGEDANCVLTGFTITGGYDDAGAGIRCFNSSPTISHCIIVGNRAYRYFGGGVECYQSQASFVNCTISDNYARWGGGGVFCEDSNALFVNCIIWDNTPDQIQVSSGNEPTVLYSDIQDDFFGEGNINEYPCFAAPGLWVDRYDPNTVVEPNSASAVWLSGDYHLMSREGRFEPDSKTWVKDGVDSPCIDTGDPNSDYSTEPNPNGACINIGAYGGTAEASKSTTITNVFLRFDLDNDPGWAVEGDWQFGTPLGDGGVNGNPDPSSGYTGTNVYGVNLAGDYRVDVGGPYCLTAGPFDCSGYQQVSLRFARWLNSDFYPYVANTLEVSNDGQTWQIIWQSQDGQLLADSKWQVVNYDISAIADGQPAVYVRWSYEIASDRALEYSGWNIDDIELRAAP